MSAVLTVIKALIGARRSRRVAADPASKVAPADSPGSISRAGSSSNPCKRPGAQCGRYTKPEQIFAALETGHVRLVKMSWLIKQKKRLPRRQNMPEEAFISVDRLRSLHGQGNADHVVPIIAISYCWLAPNNPDPDGELLKAVQAALARERPKYADFGFDEMGVFWDWVSIHQKDDSMWKAFMYRNDSKLNERQLAQRVRYENSRTDEEAASFKWALDQTMDLWYAHEGTAVYMITELPGRFQGRRPSYADSGWTTYERCCAELIKEYDLDYANWRLVQEIELAGRKSGRAVSRGRRWPIGPDDFDELIKDKIFTNGTDAEVVKTLYRKLSTLLLGGTVALDYAKMPPPSVDDGHHLGHCLNLSTSLERLDLQSVKMSDACSVALFSSLRAGALPKLRDLQLADNRIEDDGMAALADAVARGALRFLGGLHQRATSGRISDLSELNTLGYNVITNGLNLSENPGNAAPVWRQLELLKPSVGPADEYSAQSGGLVE